MWEYLLGKVTGLIRTRNLDQDLIVCHTPRTQAHMNGDLYLYTRTHARMHAHTHTHTHTHRSMHAHTHNTHAQALTHTQFYTHTNAHLHNTNTHAHNTNIRTHSWQFLIITIVTNDARLFKKGDLPIYKSGASLVMSSVSSSGPQDRAGTMSLSNRLTVRSVSPFNVQAPAIGTPNCNGKVVTETKGNLLQMWNVTLLKEREER